MNSLNHFLAAKIRKVFSDVDAAKVMGPDALRAYLDGLRDELHFTVNPDTGKVSGITFPVMDVKLFSPDIMEPYRKEYAGRPGEAIIDEATDAEAFWYFNCDPTRQNILFFLHPIQDSCYDDYIRYQIDTEGRYEDRFVFRGQVMTGAELRGNGIQRWNGEGLLIQLDTQVYVRLAKLYYKVSGVLANRQWIEDVVKPAVYTVYPKDLADNTVKFLRISDLAEDIITTKDFDREVWPVENWLADRFISVLLQNTDNVIRRFRLNLS